jgi:hypothetical protein
MNETNFLTEPETDIETMTYILKRWTKEAKRYKSTFYCHTRRNCEEVSRCAVHAPRGRRRK